MSSENKSALSNATEKIVDSSPKEKEKDPIFNGYVSNVDSDEDPPKNDKEQISEGKLSDFTNFDQLPSLQKIINQSETGS